MTEKLFDQMISTISSMDTLSPVGRVKEVSSGTVQVAQIVQPIRVGDRAQVYSSDLTIAGEVIKIGSDSVFLLIDGSPDGISIGDRVTFSPPPKFSPCDEWVGRVIDPDGTALDDGVVLRGPSSRRLRADPPSAHHRRPLGARLETGLAVFNTLLPIVRGQRVGLFAGSGVGKSTLLGDLARGVEADVIIIALVGERGREVRGFVADVLGPEGMKRAIVVAATSDRSPQIRRRCAWAAVATAEHFRDQGKQVLLIIDSITRFCEAHREVAIAGGENANLRGFPASTNAAVASLCERAGPGADEMGDITAIFSVLVAGSDMDEPIADILRGILDGHVVLDRDIAERGRFPAIDVLRSVSRSLPAAATEQENKMISQARGHLGAYDRAELMIQSGLYTAGSDKMIDAAIACAPNLDDFLSLKDQRGTMAHFAKLRQAILPGVTKLNTEDFGKSGG